MRTDDELREQIRQQGFWWHTVELRPGIVTPGQVDGDELLTQFGIPDDLTGKTVLDIGCWDGFYSFECERRGASRVVASDLWEWAGHGEFDLIREELGSAVVPLECSVYDLPDRLWGERFDLVLFFGVLYHLRHPLLGLEAVAACTKPGGLVIVDSLVGGAKDDGQGQVHLAPGAFMNYLGGRKETNDLTNWWAPNPAAVCLMLEEVGYRRIWIGPYYDPGRPRCVFHAVKASDEDCMEHAAEERRIEHQVNRYGPRGDM